MDGVRITYEALSDSVVRCRIDVTDPARIGHAAELRITRKVIVKNDRPVHASEALVSRKIAKLELRNVIDLDRGEFQAFSYDGHKIDIEIHTELKIDDGFVFDTKLTEESQIVLSPRPRISGNAREIADPHDAYDLMSNIAALSGSGKVATTGLLILGVIIIAINSLMGVHDQFVDERSVWFYDHHRSNGKSELPLQKSLMGSAGIGIAVWFAIKKQLRGYMKFELHGVPRRICRGDALPVKSLVRGRSRVALDRVVLRVVACNVEKGQYVTGSGKNRRTKSFVEPVRALVLYEKKFARIPADTPIESLLDGEIDFAPMFRSLYPPQRVTRTHGLEVYWEVQLLHGKYMDQEVVGPVECFPWNDFLAA
jgi:hypothetical protein